MKRVGNLWHLVTDMDNLRKAHARASKGKAHYRQVKKVNKDPDKYLRIIQESLLSKTFTTSEYAVGVIFDGRKFRDIHKLPYFPDRIVQHALMAVVGDTLISSMIRDTFQSLPGRGTSDAVRRVSSFVRSEAPPYALKIDIHKFYPSVKNYIMKQIIRLKIKCKDTLWLMDDIIDSVLGLPIGNYTSQVFGNLYLTMLDWYVKQTERVSGYFRYCDDILFFGNSPKELLELKDRVGERLTAIGLSIKPNWNIYDVHKNGVDFVGYVFSPTRTRLRRKIASRLYRSVTSYSPRSARHRSSVMSYKGWIMPTNCHGLFTLNVEPRLRARYHKQLRNLHANCSF